jgi:hypothetical protein
VDKSHFPPFLPIFISGAVVGVVGWLGVAYILLATDPLLGYRWLLYFFIVLALSGSALPVVAFFNRRFPTAPAADEGVLLRQAIWVGLLGSLCVWLQQGRILNAVIAFFLAVGLVLVEIFLRMGERSRWRPDQGQENE